MIKHFFLGLAKFLVTFTVCAALGTAAVYFIYNHYAIDSQVLIDEYEQIAQEKEIVLPTPEPTPAPSPTPTPAPDWPDVDTTSWEFLLANKDHNIGQYKPPATKYFDGCLMDSRIVDAAKALTQAARGADYSVYLTGGYKSHAEINTAYTQAGEGTRTAEVAEPGTSEHQTGLCIDFTATKNGPKDATAADKPISGWLARHAHEYGFILRYPEGKEEVTGVEYSPWHYRYVGVEAATYIYEKELCLEEFLELYK